jgi:hypothetical protein
MKVVRAMLSIVVVFVACTALFAKLMGQGEVTGEVIESWLSGDRVIFSLNITDQKNEQGPALGSPNKFAYAGPDKKEVTKGDVIRLRYNSDDSYGIQVENVVFIDNKPSTVTEGYDTLWVLVPIVTLVAAGLLFLMKRRRSRVAATRIYLLIIPGGGG